MTSVKNKRADKIRKRRYVMKKIMTFMFTLILAIGCIFGLTACGGDKVKLIDIKLTDEEYGFVMKEGNTALKTSFDAYLAEIKENGEFDAIMAKYFEGVGEKTGYSYSGDGTSTITSDLKEADKFVVATNCPFEPFEYISDGKIYGVDMEIAAGYAAKHNLQLVIQNIDFDAIFTALDAGYVDIGMAGVTESPERSSYLFTTHYYNASLQLIVAADNKDFDACTTAKEVENVLKELKGKTIGYQAGTTADGYVKGFSNITAKSYNTAALATYDLTNGNIYAVVVDNAPAAAIVKSYNK